MAEPYTATEDLYVARGVKAFSAGDSVPASNTHVKRWADEGKVSRKEPSAPAPKEK